MRPSVILLATCVAAVAPMIRCQLEVKACTLPASSLLWVGGATREFGGAAPTDRTIVQLLDPSDRVGLQAWLEGSGVVLPVERLSRQEVLVHVERGTQPGFYLVNSESGKSTFLAPGAAETFVGTHERTLVLRESRSRGELAFQVVAYSLDGTAGPRVVGQGQYFQVLDFSAGRVLALTNDKSAPEILVVSINADAEAVSLGTWPSLARAWGVRGAFSPDGNLVAFSVMPSEGHLKWRLVVRRASNGELVREWDIESVDVSPLSSMRPTLEFVWLDQDALRWSETRAPKDVALSILNGSMWWVDARVSSGQLFGEREYRTGLELRHEVQADVPDEHGRMTVGKFQLAPGRLTVPGQETPLIDSWERPDRKFYSPIRVSPCGQYAAGIETEPGVITLNLATAEPPRASPIEKGRAPLFGWLPSR